MVSEPPEFMDGEQKKMYFETRSVSKYYVRFLAPLFMDGVSPPAPCLFLTSYSAVLAS